ncbi:polysaccharide deacetylase family protein [Diaporthe amygdali]|uniref:polysaccharide deacetylase family protein n=1 Tax=Phomopsis amygdali TaxID=1214568 RepID=UPI0022FDE1AC|nr:polysaccharide deacetylase family protein [Diaporthe amygdali]KAJ0107235.1 polysaccharide deacetylase family protein [Diaporthe amygdali]
MHYSLILSSFLALVVAHPVPDPVTIFSRAPTPGTVYTKCSTPNTLALAYDDGPYQYTQSLVTKLNQAGVKGTFFFTGTLYGCIYNQAAAVKAAYDGGHQVASHTWTHGHVGSMSSSQLTTEMTKLEQAFVNIFGKKPAYMRPPYLETGGSVTSVMKSLGYNIITDDIDTGDWNGQTAAQSQAKFQAAGASGNGHIPLMHETYSSTVNDLTTWLINWAKTNNLKIVTVGDASGAYQSGTFPGNGQNTC